MNNSILRFKRNEVLLKLPQMNKCEKIFIIGLDGGTWDILKPLMEEGVMPNLSKLVNEGTSGILKSTIPPVTAPAWASFQTGVNPGKHGIYEFNQYKPGSYRTFFVSSNNIKEETIWQRLSKHRKKIISVNVPLTYPPRKINGYMITGMLTPGIKSNFTYPPELAKEILKIEKNYTIITTQQYFNVWGLEKFINKLIKTEKKRLKITRYLINKYEWDLAMVHFHSSDVLQHALYCYIDRKDTHFNIDTYNRICSFYKSLDENLGDLLNNLPKTTLKIIISDHGFGPVYKTIYINNFLIEKGFIKLEEFSLFKKNLLIFMKFLRRMDRKYIRFLFSPSKRAKLRGKVRLDKIIDWSRTKSFMINGWVYGNIYLNCIGREEKGLINFGKEYDDLRIELSKLFLALKDPETNKRIIKKVLKREEIYKGECLNNAPDLILIPEDGYEFSSTFIGKSEDLIRKNKLKESHTGSHRREGICVFNGEFIKKGEILKEAYIEDLFPTILYYFGINIPKYIDGKVLTSIFREDFLKNRIIKFEGLKDRKMFLKDKEAYSKEEKRRIEKRLKDLGYI